MTDRLAPTDVTTDPASLALISQGLCACHAALDKDLSNACRQPIDVDSLLHMCAGHDHTFQQMFPGWYGRLTGRPAIQQDAVSGSPTPAEIEQAEEYLRARTGGVR